MIFYHPDCDLRFSEYGIEIPIVDDRASHVFSALQFLYPYLEFTNLKSLERITRDDLERVHTKDFMYRLFGTASERQSEIYKCYELVNDEGQFERFNPKNQKRDWKELLETILLQVSMTYASSKYALKNGFSYYLGGGMHHSMSFAGRGFCLVNDMVITLKKMQSAGLIKTAWIVDVDVHKGDGAPEILKLDPTIKTFSIHMKEGWPLNSGTVRDPWFIPSTVDVGIEIGEEDQYLARLEAGLLELEENSPKPDLVIVVNGADPYEYDALPSASFIKLSKEQMLDRDKYLYQFFKSRNIPQSYVMAGGYGEKSWEIYLQFLKFVGENSSFQKK
ncbi:MAG: histone deacetylase [Bacteriovorax sp.]|nr:histone deacetylase [Bacteriovorax sp.]